MKKTITDLKETGGNLKIQDNDRLASGFSTIVSLFRSRPYQFLALFAAGILFLFFFRFLLKKYVKNILFRCIINIVLVISLGALSYMAYISYLSHQLDLFGKDIFQKKTPDNPNDKTGDNPHFTPRKLLEQTKELVDEINTRTKETEKMGDKK
ncbi:MAG: hypothetical protein V1753_05575 [Pseudomonadota bacterium]